MKVDAGGLTCRFTSVLKWLVPSMGGFLLVFGCTKGTLTQEKGSPLKGRNDSIDVVYVDQPLSPIAQKIREKTLIALKELYKKNPSPSDLKLSPSHGDLPQPVAEAILEVLKAQTEVEDFSSNKYPCRINTNLIRPYEVLYGLQRAGLGSITRDELIGEMKIVLGNKRWQDVLGYPLKSKDLVLALENWFQFLEREHPKEVRKQQVSASLGLKKVTLPVNYFDTAIYDREGAPYTIGTPVPWIDHILKWNEVPKLGELYGATNRAEMRCFAAGVVTRLNFNYNGMDDKDLSTIFAALRDVDVFEYVRAIESKDNVTIYGKPTHVDSKSLIAYINSKNLIDTLVINLSLPSDPMERKGILGQLNVPVLNALAEPVRMRIKTFIFDLWGLTRVIEQDSCSFRLIRPDVVSSLLSQVKSRLPQAVNFGIEDTLYWGNDYGKYTNIALVQSVIKGIDNLGAQKLLIETKNYNEILDHFPELNRIKSVKIQAHYSYNKESPHYPMKKFELSQLLGSLKNVENIWLKDAQFSIETQKLASLYKRWENSNTESKLENLRFSQCVGLPTNDHRLKLDLPFGQFPALRSVVSENCNIDLPTSPKVIKKLIIQDPNQVQWYPR